MGRGLIPPALILPLRLPPSCVEAPVAPPGPPEKAFRRRLRDPNNCTNSAAGASKEAGKSGEREGVGERMGWVGERGSGSVSGGGRE